LLRCQISAALGQSATLAGAAQPWQMLLASSEMLTEKPDHLSVKMLMKIVTVEARRIGASRRVTLRFLRGVQVARKEKCLAFVTK